MKGALDIFSYNNYRKLLEDFYQEQKAAAKSVVSHRYLARRAGFASSNFIYLVIKGRRNLSYDSIQRIARVLGLTKRELLFFEGLVHCNQTTDPTEKEQAFRKMLAFREYREARQISAEQYDYFAKWYYPVIREMVNLREFREEPAWIAKTLTPSIAVDAAREALEKLQQLGLLVRAADGRLRQADQNLTTTTDGEAASAALLSFHQSMIEHGKRSLAQPAATREVSALTLSLSDRQFREIKARIQTLHRDVQALIANSGDEPVDHICQLNFQLFGLTQLEKRRLS
ncbi:MAG: TIGR02147 family protein [Deltaproteobacteria bacterium]|nr:TIGR02147 family protein [Deltaproteobacteria bacterium]